MPTAESILIENMLKIADKQGNDVPFILNSAQRDLDNNLTGRDIIPKARQEGISSYFLARYTIRCLTKRNTRAVIISHDSLSTERMLKKVHYFLENLSPAPVIGQSARNSITFPKMNSMFFIGTAGSKAFGRGDTITNLHCSEVAFWDNSMELMTGLMQAVPEGSGEIAIESTGNGQGNYYHKMVTGAANGRSHYKLHFYNWQDFAEYDLATTDEEAQAIIDNLDPDLEEPELFAGGLRPGQLKFRRHKLVELEYDLNKFKQEYPMTLDECFQASGSGIFSKVNYVEDERWTLIEPHLHGLVDHPQVGKQYFMGADVSGGVGNDRSAVEIFELESLEQVGEYLYDMIEPNDFGDHLVALGKTYNNAFITVEANNYGITTLDHMSSADAHGEPVYPPELIYTESKVAARGANEAGQLLALGYKTTAVSKPFIIGKLRSRLATALTIHSEALKAELSTFVEKDSGRLEAESGCFDDLVMALAMLVVPLEYEGSFMPMVEAQPKYEPSPFSMDAIIEELRGRHNSFPIDINSQVEA